MFKKFFIMMKNCRCQLNIHFMSTVCKGEGMVFQNSFEGT